MLSQEWLLAHTAIRNGMLYDGHSHAHMYLYFHTGSQSIEVFLSTGGLSPQRLYWTIHLESAVEIQSIQGIAG